jgi:hypothetical protein
MILELAQARFPQLIVEVQKNPPPVFVARRSKRTQLFHPHKQHNTSSGPLFPHPAIFCKYFLFSGYGEENAVMRFYYL